jgi:DNA-directed RNA polymerase specialized sigma24 family protein
MLDDSVVDPVADYGDIDEAIASLTEADTVRLSQAANYYSNASRYSSKELIDGAIFKALNRNCGYKPGIPIIGFLIMIMKNLAFNDRRAQKRHPELSLDVEKTGRSDSYKDNLKELGPSPEENLESKERFLTIKNTVLELFRDKPDIKDVIEGKMAELNSSEIQEIVGLSEKEYASALRLIRRRINKAFPEGWKDE